MKQWQVVNLARSFAIIAVMGVHSYVNVPFQNAWACWLWGRFCVNGFYGVLLFFVVSGFLITHVIAKNPGGLKKPDLRRFYAQRIGRIWPLFYLIFGPAVLVFMFGGPGNRWYQDWFLPGHYYGVWFWLSAPLFLFNWFLIGINDWGYAGKWNILWSLSIEEQFYLLYPLCLRKIAQRGWVVPALGGIILLALTWRTFFYFHGKADSFVQSYGTPAVLDMIAFGIILYFTAERYQQALSSNRALCAFLCLAGTLLLLLSYFGSRKNDPFQEIFVPDLLGGGLFLFLLGGLHLPAFESPLLWPLSLPGKYCYGCYLLHLPVGIVLGPYLSGFGVFTRFGLYVVATTLVAALSYHWFEMPVNQAIRKRFGRKVS